jgi:hypothetical protein
MLSYARMCLVRTAWAYPHTRAVPALSGSALPRCTPGTPGLLTIVSLCRRYSPVKVRGCCMFHVPVCVFVLLAACDMVAWCLRQGSNLRLTD